MEVSRHIYKGASDSHELPGRSFGSTLNLRVSVLWGDDGIKSWD